MAFERVPPRREAGAGLALPVFNKEREALLIFYPSEARRFFPYLFEHLFDFLLARGLCWVTICKAFGASGASGLSAIPSGFCRALGASVGYLFGLGWWGFWGWAGLAFILWGFGRVVAFGFGF